MIDSIDRLLTAYEHGTVTRRQLLQALSIAFATPSSPIQSSIPRRCVNGESGQPHAVVRRGKAVGTELSPSQIHIVSTP